MFEKPLIFMGWRAGKCHTNVRTLRTIMYGMAIIHNIMHTSSYYRVE